MKDVEVSFKSFKFKKVVALVACAVMAMGVISMPVQAAEPGYTGDVSDQNEMPESVSLLLRKYVKISNGDSVGLYYQVGNILRYADDMTADKWAEVENAMNKAFDVIVEKDLKFSWFDGKNIEDHKIYINLMNDIVKIAGGSLSYDGANTVTMVFNGSTTTQSFIKYQDRPVYMATGDAKDPSKVVDFITNTESNYINIPIHEEAQTMPKAVFQAAKESGKALSFTNKDASGNTIEFEFANGITNDVDMNFGVKTSMDNELVKNLKDEGALVFEFAHEGVLPGPMNVRFYNKAYEGVEESTAFLYLLNEKTGKLEKQEQAVTINRGWVSFTIDHCSSYVTTLTEIATDKVQVAEPKPDASDEIGTGSSEKDNAIKETSQAVGFKNMALLAIAGAAVFFATRKEEKA